VTLGRASGTGRKLWPVGMLRTPAAPVLIFPLSFAALVWLFMLRIPGADSMTSGLGPGMGQTGNMGMAETGLAASMRFLHPATDRGGVVGHPKGSDVS
jgi:hypothetical protein